MAFLLKEEILYKRVYYGRWKGERCVYKSISTHLSVVEVAFRTEETRLWETQASPLAFHKLFLA